MRDKVLYRGWAVTETAGKKNIFLLFRKSDFSFFIDFFTFLLSDSVPVSIQGGVKMSIDEFLSFFDRNKAWRDQEAQRWIFETISRDELDTIFAADSLFKGTIVDFGDLVLHSGGGNYANTSIAASQIFGT